jgi:hypothetical protein
MAAVDKAARRLYSEYFGNPQLYKGSVFKMQVVTPFKTTRLNAIKDGGILIAQVGGYMIHAIKVFFLGEDGDRTDFIVSVGPFLDGGQPTIHEAALFLGSAVLDVGAYYVFVPSVAAADLDVESNLLGKVVLMEQAVYLAASFIQAENSTVLYFVDVQSGRLYADLPGGPAMVSSRWRIEARTENSAPETILEHCVHSEEKA